MSEHVVGRVTGTRVCLRCSDLSSTGVWECQPNDQCPCCLDAQVERLTTMRAQVLRMHYRDVHPHEDRCQRDGDPWPCRDVVALRGESDE